MSNCFGLSLEKNLRLLSNLRDYWVLVHTISSILLMLVICVIRDLAPEQETPGKKARVDLKYARIDLSAFLTWSETNSTCHAWIRKRNVPASSTGFSKAQWGELNERKASNKTREAREKDGGNKHRAWAGNRNIPQKVVANDWGQGRKRSIRFGRVPRDVESDI